MKLTGSQIVAEVLLDHGVDTIFGYPGGTALNIYDELYKYSNRLKHVLTAHEQGACHAADGYARTTGKVGIVMSTSGPGATNLVTGIATAYLDSIPIIAITSNVSDSLIGKDAFQEICITGVTMPITKHNFFVNHIEDLADTLREAFVIAQSGRPGPVLVDITKDVTSATCEYENRRPLPLRPYPEIKKDDIRAAVKMINAAEKPVMYVGGGAMQSCSADLIRELAHKANIPVVNTLMAAGIIDTEDDLSLGMVGMHGSVASNRAIQHSDLIIALGARFSDRVAQDAKTWGRSARILQIDLDKSEVNKNIQIDKAIIANVKEFLEQALPYVEPAEHAEWRERTVSWKKKAPYVKATGCPLHPKDIMTTISNSVDDEAIYVTDVGQHQMWAAQYLHHRKPHKFITSGGLGTMGFGYGAAIGAQIAHPEKRVVHITGDASFQMNINEVVTAETQGLPLITVIVNNSVLGMVYQWQTIFYGERYSNTVPERKIDYVKVAEGFHIKGFRATTPEEFQDVFQQALKEDGPVWIECVISREERVLPMIPGGKSVDDMIVG